MIKKMKLYVARHGETTFNVEGRVLGHTPGNLTEKGIKQAQELATHVRNLNLEKIFSSDLPRAAETTKIVAAENPGVDVTYTKQLRERNFGSIEGQLMADVDWNGFWNLPSDSTKYGAESLDAFTIRIARFVFALREDRSGVIGIVTHIGVMNRLNHLLDPKKLKFINYPNANAIEFEYETLLQNSKDLLEQV